jgi:hypothetical protein
MIIRVNGTTWDRRAWARSIYSYWPDQLIE